MINPVRLLLRGVLRLVDRIYHWRHKSVAVGPLVLVSPATFEGPQKRFNDGTVLQPGDPIGEIHFDNRVSARFVGQTSRTAAISFLGVLRTSLSELAGKAATEAPWREYRAYRGITWMPPRGKSIGFEHEPLPESDYKRYLERYFKLLVWVVASAKETRENAKIEPVAFWMTRDELLSHHLKARTTVEE